MNGTPPLSSSGYRPEIDGLRALAVIAVVLYHAELGCPGGYVGVDVFFVISGFLITSLILRDLRRGTFSLVDFWERRIRRILPALLASVAATLLAAWFLLLPDDLKSLGDSAIAQGVMGANFYFWQTTNYFGGENLSKPLLHTWSLAVEEQFYLLLPLALVFLFARRIQRPTIIASFFGILWLLSFAISVWGTKNQPYATFFLLPTRAWELLCGAFIAALPLKKHLPKGISELISALGLGAIIASILTYTESTSFPGWAALPPCLGTAAIIWANQHQPSKIARTLSLAPLRSIGLISYSLYLWHWPLLAFADYWKTTTLDIATRCALVAIAFALAWLSWKWIETPVRKKHVCGTRKSLFIVVALGSGILILIGSIFSIGAGLPGRLPDDVKAFIAKNDERQKARLSASDPTSGLSVENIESGELPPLGKDSSEKPHFLIWGDSHAKVQLPLLDRLASERELFGQAITIYGTPPLIGENFQQKFEETKSDAISQAVLSHVANLEIEEVFLVGFWSLYQEHLGAELLETRLLKTIASLEESGARVTILQSVPSHQSDVLRLLVRDRFPGWPGTVTTLGSRSEHQKKNSALYSASSRPLSAQFIDPSPTLWDPKSSAYLLALDGTPLYYDSNHLSRTGVEYTWKPLLEPVLDAMIANP